MDKKILAHLSKDPIMAKVVAGTPLEMRHAPHDPYFSLIRAIVFQQLSGKAAETIHNRFLSLFEGGYPHPDQLMNMEMETLRSVGLSRQKGTYVQNVAAFFEEHKLLDKDWEALTDEYLLKTLTRIKGVGQWTVEMLLMFTLNRPDILPVDDLGIQQAMQRLYGIEEKGKQLHKRMLEIAEAWRPYRTYASLYLWRWKDQ
ncbi:MAG TPA: DNA-3-methyladenine glycosylase 2 family protein [Flavilitoribacter sp.]|nr:DNA-3-methyladenine glycosylase 2 family protein [Flavilitoribacter sp.]HMQ91037.1 DNA-3-methyladenine glycosylase 2 family protein [Flavilitoribacter sp.]